MSFCKQLILTIMIGAAPFLAAGAPPQIQSISGENILTGQKISVNSIGHKGLVAVFLSAHCPCSNSHLIELQNLAQTYPEFVFVGIHSNADEGFDVSKPYFQKAHLPFPVIQDTHQVWADRLRAFKTPHSFVFTADGKVVYQGGVSDSHEFENSNRQYLREALADLHEGKPVRTPEGRTLGCAIARENSNVW